MIQYHFSCRLLSDVIISSASATEGFNPSLDYLPGSKFWGIVATRFYNEEENEQTKLDLFHNGKVHFGDAHLEINGKPSYKMPLSWFKNKHHKEEGIYVHHAVEDYDALTAGGIQPEQVEGDYFNENGDYAKPTQDFSIKSAYDSKLRRSEDEKMFGYYALPSGGRWQFTVSSNSKELLDKVKIALEGKKRIGRSRSAQYGQAEISFVKETRKEIQTLATGLHFLYAESPIMLPLEMPLSEALPGDIIDFEKSKIRTRIYQSWNTHRHTRDADRQIIEKSSVIAVNLKTETDANELLKNLQERSAEGFGQVLIDPDFLIKVRDGHFAALPLKEWKQEKATNQIKYNKAGASDQMLLELLKKRQVAHSQVQSIDLAVNAFASDKKNEKAFRSVTASQWGTVRSLAKLFPDLQKLKEELFADGKNGERKGYLVSGIAEEKWRAGKEIIRKILEEKGTYPSPRHLFLEKLATEMAKHKR